MSDRYNRFTPIIQLDEITHAEENMLEDLVSLVDSPSGYFVRKVGGSFINESLSSMAVTDVSVLTANGFSGSVANSTTTPEITLNTIISGVLKGNGVGLSSAVDGVDYLSPVTGTNTSLSNLASVAINTSLLLSASDGGSLGSGGKMWSDLFLASGGVIDWNNGNATLTHSAGLLTLNVPLSLGTSNALTVGSIELGHVSDTTITRISAGVVAIAGVNILTTAGGTLTGNITLGEGVDPATIGIVIDASISADERYSGITAPGTAGATLAFGDLCYLDVTAGEWLLADADAALTSGDVPLGICVDASTDGNATSMLLIGTVRSAAFPASIALGAPVYVSTTAGDIQAAQPSGTDDVIRRVGWAVSGEPNTIYFNPSNDYITHT